MSKSSSNYIKNTNLKDILHGMSDLETPVLESFYKEISNLIAGRKAKALSKKESDLFLIINRSPFDSEQRNRYVLLYEKLQNEKIKAEETEELSVLIELQEKQGVERLKALVELATLRQVSLDSLMKDLGIPNITPDVTTQPTTKIKEKVADRAEYRCEYCQALRSYSPSPFDTEHIKPYSLGGLSILENLAYSCHGCNSYKSNRIKYIDPVSDISVPLFHPRTDDWQTHFNWSDDTLLIIGMTPTGRATVECLNLNREELVNLRELLKLVGKHPPV